MSLDSINFKKSVARAQPTPTDRLPRHRSEPDKKKRLALFLVTLAVAVIVTIWAILLRYSFFNLAASRESASELEKVKTGFSKTLEDFSNELDDLKNSQVYSMPSLTPEEIRELEGRLFNEAQKSEATPIEGGEGRVNLKGTL